MCRVKSKMISTTKALTRPMTKTQDRLFPGKQMVENYVIFDENTTARKIGYVKDCNDFKDI